MKILLSCIFCPATHLPWHLLQAGSVLLDHVVHTARENFSIANKSQPPRAGDETVLQLLSRSILVRVRLVNSTDKPSAGAQCILELLKTFSTQKSKLQLAESIGFTLSTSPIFANKLLTVLHFSLGDSVLIHLGTFLAPSRLLLLTAP